MKDNKQRGTESIEELCHWKEEFKRTGNSFLGRGLTAKKLCKPCDGYTTNCQHYLSQKMMNEEYHITTE